MVRIWNLDWVIGLRIVAIFDSLGCPITTCAFSPRVPMMSLGEYGKSLSMLLFALRNLPVESLSTMTGLLSAHHCDVRSLAGIV